MVDLYDWFRRVYLTLIDKSVLLAEILAEVQEWHFVT